MRVPDFSSLAGCAVDVVTNMNNEANAQNGVINNYDEGSMTSSAKFVQQALNTTTAFYAHDDCYAELGLNETNNYELMPTSNTYKSFKEFLNNNHNNNNNQIAVELDKANFEFGQQQHENDYNLEDANENVAISVNDANDDSYSYSSSSLSSISRTSKGLYIPRGIVNPNYPGFQHLAHTLSEHFIVSVPTTDESDLSENEMELSTDSFDDLTEQCKDNTMQEMPATNSLYKSKLSCMGASLETALALPEYSLANGDYYKVKHFLSLEHLENIPDIKCCTPDIVESSSLKGSFSKLENHPDLLLGINDNEPQVLNSAATQVVADEVAVTMTPMVDIIGDFGEEVEREFGLLVNGYKNLTLEEQTEEQENKCVMLTGDQQVEQLQQKNSQNNNNNNNNIIFKPCYKKHSYDERQLPPIGVDYSRCQQKQAKIKAQTLTHQNAKPNFTLRQKHNGGGSILKKNQCKARQENQAVVSELNQYKQLMSDKESILSKSRYAKISSWAQYLKDTNDTARNDILTPNALALFDAYKISSEMDNETLKKHLKLAKEIEKKRRNNREEIRRRLAGSGDEEYNEPFTRHAAYEIPALTNDYMSSDNESHSSDSETCPKLSRKRQPRVQQITASPTPSKMNACAGPIGLNVPSTTEAAANTASEEDKECDFFTKQAVLQIEARMALAQSKEIAHLQMKMERKRLSMSPITHIVHASMSKVGFQMTATKRRITRQILTNMSVAHLQILVNNFHTHIEEFNAQLVNLLMKRDDLHLQQDDLLTDIEDMTRYLGVNYSQQNTYPV